MITLNKKQKVIIEYRKGKSLREIARTLEMNRQTVTSYVRAYEKSVRELLELGKDEDIKKFELIDDIVEKPKYKPTKREKRKVTQELIDSIQIHLDENEVKIEKGMGKIQKSKKDIHEALKKEGFDVSYCTVSNTINTMQNKGAEAFIKQKYALGDVCEFDWGEVKIIIDGEVRKYYMAVFTSARGNYRYALLFQNQDTSCFLEAHSKFFEQIGGSYRTMVYDNMKVAVKKFVGRFEKEPTEALLKLSMYYGFDFRFCNVRSGNEKGHVEKSVEYVRRKAFCDDYKFSSFQEANIHLLEYCKRLNNEQKKYYDNKTALDILKEEKAYLLPNKPKMDTSKVKELRVDKYSTICINNSHYSVPEQYVNKLIFTKIYSEIILCYYDKKLIAKHNRANKAYEWIIDINHYVNTLKRKPGALKNSLALDQAPQEIKKIYNDYYIRKEKDFIELLQFIKEKNKSINDIKSSIEIIQKVSPLDISTEKIISVCSRNKDNIKETITPYKSNSEILENSRNLLKSLGNLIPSSDENFIKERTII